MAKKKTKDAIDIVETVDAKKSELKKIKAEPVLAKEKVSKKAVKAESVEKKEKTTVGKKEPKKAAETKTKAVEEKVSKKAVKAESVEKKEKTTVEKKEPKKAAETKTKAAEKKESKKAAETKTKAVEKKEEETTTDKKKRGRPRKEVESEAKKEEVIVEKGKKETKKKASQVEEVIPVKDERPFVQTIFSKKQEEERAAEQAFIESTDIQSRPDIRYSDEDLEMFEKRILDFRKESIEELRMLRDRLDDLTNYDFAEESMIYSMHMAEQGSEALEKEKTYAHIQRINEYIKKLDDALQRIKEKTYGICRVCGCLIAKERLLAVPITTLSASYKIHKKCPDDGIDRIEQPKPNNESYE